VTTLTNGTESQASTRRVRPPRPSQRAASVSIAIKQSRQAQQQGGQVNSHAAGMNEGMRVLSYLIAGVALYGGLGWLADHLLGTGFWLPIGIVLGAAAAVYVIIRRFGRVDGTVPITPKATTGEGAR
jgi:ATP synthase protein I